MAMNMPNNPVLIIVMGVSGSGKSTVAKQVASDLSLHYLEADDFHSEENKKHMAEGKPLSDAMREPWIHDLCNHLTEAYARTQSCVLAYSGLRRAHRQRFRDLPYTVVFIYLSGDPSLIMSRMKKREQHFMPVSLLESQFDSLELPDAEEPVWQFGIDKPLVSLCEDIRAVLHKVLAIG